VGGAKEVEGKLRGHGGRRQHQPWEWGRSSDHYGAKKTCRWKKQEDTPEEQSTSSRRDKKIQGSRIGGDASKNIEVKRDMGYLEPAQGEKEMKEEEGKSGRVQKGWGCRKRTVSKKKKTEKKHKAVTKKVLYRASGDAGGGERSLRIVQVSTKEKERRKKEGRNKKARRKKGERSNRSL